MECVEHAAGGGEIDQVYLFAHRCVKNHVGSAKLMECESGVQGIKELAEEGTPVEILEGDRDTTTLAYVKIGKTLEKTCMPLKN